MSSDSNYITGSLTGDVLRKLRDRTGLYLPDKPMGEIPSLPHDITILSDDPDPFTRFVIGAAFLSGTVLALLFFIHIGP